jgi:CheY-specific phosphatase CheX
MQNKQEMELYRAAVLTFEDLCLTLPTEALNDRQRSAVPAAAVSLEFKGSSQGRLVVMVSSDLLSLLPSNMLALNGPVEKRDQFDALREVANVICGNMLPRVTGSDEAFKISPPELINVSETSALSALSPTAEVHIGIDLGRADLFLFMDKPRA